MARILFAFVCLIARVSTTLAAGKLVQELNPQNKQQFKTQRDRIVAYSVELWGPFLESPDN